MDRQWRADQYFACRLWMNAIQRHTLGKEGQEKNLQEEMKGYG